MPEPRALKSDNLLLHLLAPLAAALHVCHSSSPSVFAVCLAACSACSPVACCESARAEEQSRPREAHGNVRCKALGTHPSARTCSPRRLQQPAAPSRQTPPNAASRAPRILAAWPARTALACDSSSGAPTPGWLASRHEATLAATHPKPLPLQPHVPPPRASDLCPGCASLRVMIIGQPEGQRLEA